MSILYEAVRRKIRAKRAVVSRTSNIFVFASIIDISLHFQRNLIDKRVNSLNSFSHIRDILYFSPTLYINFFLINNSPRSRCHSASKTSRFVLYDDEFENKTESVFCIEIKNESNCPN